MSADERPLHNRPRTPSLFFHLDGDEDHDEDNGDEDHDIMMKTLSRTMMKTLSRTMMEVLLAEMGEGVRGRLISGAPLFIVFIVLFSTF